MRGTPSGFCVVQRTATGGVSSPSAVTSRSERSRYTSISASLGVRERWLAEARVLEGHGNLDQPRASLAERLTEQRADLVERRRPARLDPEGPRERDEIRRVEVDADQAPAGV